MGTVVSRRAGAAGVSFAFVVLLVDTFLADVPDALLFIALAVLATVFVISETRAPRRVVVGSDGHR
jgi:hypothetical protein